MRKKVALLCSLFILCLPFYAKAAPRANLWPVWQQHNAQSTQTIDHHLWQQFLNQYVITNAQGVNLVRYRAVSKQDKAQLENYIKQLSQVRISQYNRAVQLAYWIDLYNALTVDVVLSHYPVNSILDIRLSNFWQKGPWNKKLIRVQKHALSLNDIEHRIIRPIWHDPRTHYALNCASYSCPNLQKQAFTGKNLDHLLNKAAIAYVNSPRGVAIIDNQLVVSSIYDWYQSDFGGNQAGVIAHLKRYARPKLKKQLQKFNTISGYRYNWDLNQTNK